MQKHSPTNHFRFRLRNYYKALQTEKITENYAWPDHEK